MPGKPRAALDKFSRSRIGRIAGGFPGQDAVDGPSLRPVWIFPAAPRGAAGFGRIAARDSVAM